MWDETFTSINSSIQTDLDNNNHWDAYDKMHNVLNDVWKHIPRVLSPNGIVCINIGDATRTLNNQFTRFPNHETITTRLKEQGLQPLTNIIWHKPTNSPAKYMGSGMRPPNAYVTLEHEHILIFRNGDSTRNSIDIEQRNKSAYFMEERNEWFSDLWTNIIGEKQSFTTKNQTRNKTAAYPLEIPHRLINMFSVYNDTVLDPFWGTGTTTLAAMYNARNSIGFEINPELLTEFQNNLGNIKRKSKTITHNRLQSHHEYITTKYDTESKPKLNHYNTSVMREQQSEMEFYTIQQITQQTDTELSCTHELYNDWNPTQEQLQAQNKSLTEY